jgi:hypothetical protein
VPHEHDRQGAVLLAQPVQRPPRVAHRGRVVVVVPAPYAVLQQVHRQVLAAGGRPQRLGDEQHAPPARVAVAYRLGAALLTAVQHEHHGSWPVRHVDRVQPRLARFLAHQTTVTQGP